MSDTPINPVLARLIEERDATHYSEFKILWAASAERVALVEAALAAQAEIDDFGRAANGTLTVASPLPFCQVGTLVPLPFWQVVVRTRAKGEGYEGAAQNSISRLTLTAAKRFGIIDGEVK